MAPGGYGSGSGIPLSQRRRVGATPPSPAAGPDPVPDPMAVPATARSPEATEPPPQPSPARHCWIAESSGPSPGLLLEWRRTETGYDGLVAHAVLLRPGRWATVLEWLPAVLLTPRDD